MQFEKIYVVIKEFKFFLKRFVFIHKFLLLELIKWKWNVAQNLPSSWVMNFMDQEMNPYNFLLHHVWDDREIFFCSEDFRIFCGNLWVEEDSDNPQTQKRRNFDFEALSILTLERKENICARIITFWPFLGGETGDRE